jgi:hypothetical protein
MEVKDRKAEQRKIRLQILNIQERHCADCTLPPPGTAVEKQKYCWTHCTHGMELRKLADELVSDPGEKGFAVMIPETMEPTKENYLFLKNKLVTEKRVAEIFGCNVRALRKQKEDWGLPKIHDRDTKNKSTAPAPGVIVITMDEYDTLNRDRDRAVKSLLKKTKESQATYQSMKERELALSRELASVKNQYSSLQELFAEAANVFNRRATNLF